MQMDNAKDALTIANKRKLKPEKEIKRIVEELIESYKGEDEFKYDPYENKEDVD
jgi:ribosomal protein S17E